MIDAEYHGYNGEFSVKGPDSEEEYRFGIDDLGTRALVYLSANQLLPMAIDIMGELTDMELIRLIEAISTKLYGEPKTSHDYRPIATTRTEEV